MRINRTLVRLNRFTDRTNKLSEKPPKKRFPFNEGNIYIYEQEIKGGGGFMKLSGIISGKYIKRSLTEEFMSGRFIWCVRRP